MGVKERVQEISNNKNVKIGMGPVTAKIELTGRCNFDCLYCNHHDMAHRNQRQRIMSADDFDTVINYIKISDTKDLAVIIKDKYKLFGMQVSKENFQEDNIEELIKKVKIINDYNNIQKSKFSVEDLEYIITVKEMLKK